MSLRFTMLLAWATGIGLTTAGLAPLPADETAKAQEAKVTYDDHVRPILREHCFSCHNQNGSKGGLALDNYARVIEGGSSGEVVVEQDLESSRLWSLVSHEEEPFMPPGQDKLPDAKLDIIRKWIEGGLLENSGSTAKAPKKTLNLAAPTSTGRPEGPVAMPEGLSREPVVFTERAAAVSAVAASPWAPLVAVAGQQQIALYNSDDGRLLGVLPFPEGIPYALRFSRDGSHLLAGGGHGASLGIAALYDVKTGERLLTVGDELDAVLAADINNNLTRIALGGPGRIVRIYSVQTGELVHEIRKHTDWIYAVRFSPDGVLLATADRSNGLFVWEADTAREYLDLRGHGDAVTDVAWRLDSNILASASLDGTVRLWEMNEGKEIARTNAHGGGVNAVAYTHDGRIVSAGQDRTVKLWDGALKPQKTFPAFPEPALRVTFTHDGKRVVAGDWSGSVKMWNTDDDQEIGQLPPNPPTLAMRLAERQQQLADATALAEKATAEYQAAQQQVAAVMSQAGTTVASAETKLQQTEQLAAKARAEAAAATSQVAASTAEVQKAEQAVEAAKKALADATTQLQQLAASLEQMRQAEQTAKNAVSQADTATQQAAAEVATAKAAAAKQQEEAAKLVAPKKAALDAAQAKLDELKALVDQLAAEKAAAEAARQPASDGGQHP